MSIQVRAPLRTCIDHSNIGHLQDIKTLNIRNEEEQPVFFTSPSNNKPTLKQTKKLCFDRKNGSPDKYRGDMLLR